MLESERRKHVEKDKRNSTFDFYGKQIKPGTRSAHALPIPELYVHTDLSAPVHIVNGKFAGPVLFLSGAVHGDEIIGVEVIRRVLASKRLKALKGTLIAVPVVNIFGFLNQSRYLPDRRDLNRSFPGSVKGSIAGRLAHLFLSEVVSKSTHGIDLHTAAVNRENLPQVRADTSDPAVEAMARAFSLPVIVDSSTIEGSLRRAACDLGVKIIVYEAGEALRFDETAIRGGVNGVLKVMEHLGMLKKRRPPKRFREPTLTRFSRWVRAPQSGIHRSMVPLGALVNAGDHLGFIADPLGENETPVVADRGGVIIGRSNIPLVTEGEALFHIASFEGSVDEVAAQIDRVEEVLDAVTDDTVEPPIV